MKRKVELLAPGGSIDSIKAAVMAGADAIYCGLDKFNARNRASNLNFDDLQAVLLMAHNRNCEIFLTINIIIVENEIPALIKLLNKLINTGIDALIVQDLGLFYILKKYFKHFKVHASTQCTTHNYGQIDFLSNLNAERVNLSRELNLSEIKELSLFSSSKNIDTEVFVHGSNCLSFSGLCYMSSVHGGNSGNRGRCSQPCRDEYKTTSQNKKYPLNLKDNSAFSNLEELYKAGVGSLKIEGRIKKFDYVYTVVSLWRQQLNNLYNGFELNLNKDTLYKVFNRDLSNDFLTGRIGSDMFIDNPRDYSVLRVSEDKLNNNTVEENISILFKEKEILRQIAANKINELEVAKEAVCIEFLGEIGECLQIIISTPAEKFVLHSKSLIEYSEFAINKDDLYKRFKSIDETEYFLDSVKIDNLNQNSFISFAEITRLKKQVLFLLNNSRENISPIELPAIKNYAHNKPAYLSVLISSVDDLYLLENTDAKIYYQIPESLNKKYYEIFDVLTENEQIIPWFPSVIIGEDYELAKQILKDFPDREIVSNNTGICFEAYKNNIKWIAGPYLNTINSYALLCLKEEFNCSGAFISNEINKNQMKKIKCPENFDLYYSIYHPLLLLTSRQCLFHQVDGCSKIRVDNKCIESCEKHSNLDKLNGDMFFLDKKAGNYHCIYNDKNYLNCDIIEDKKDFFTSYFIDLRDVKTDTKLSVSKTNIIHEFNKLLNNESVNMQSLISNTDCSQYIKGI